MQIYSVIINHEGFTPYLHSKSFVDEESANKTVDNLAKEFLENCRLFDETANVHYDENKRTVFLGEYPLVSYSVDYTMI